MSDWVARQGGLSRISLRSVSYSHHPRQHTRYVVGDFILDDHAKTRSLGPDLHWTFIEVSILFPDQFSLVSPFFRPMCHTLLSLIPLEELPGLLVVGYVMNSISS